MTIQQAMKLIKDIRPYAGEDNEGFKEGRLLLAFIARVGIGD